LEARDRVGGRTASKEVDGYIVNLGATWIHGQKGNPLVSLAKRAKVELSPGISQYVSSNSTLTPRRSLALRSLARYDNAQMYYEDGKPVPKTSRAKYDATWEKFEEYLEYRQDADYDEDDPGLQDVIDDFVRKEKLTGESLKAFQYGLAANIMDEYAGSTELLSLWFDEDASEKGGDPVVLGGFDDMVKFLLKGVPVLRSARVTKVDYSRPSVKVTTSSSKTFTAKKAVIVTVPLGVLKANTIKFTPTLPSRNRKAIAGLGMGLLNKCVLVFDKSFWGTTEEWIERISTTGFQSTLSMMPVADQPILYGFNSAENARRVEAWSDAKTCDTLMSHMRTIWPNAPKYTDCVVTRWGKDPNSRGSYSFTSKRMEYDPAHSGVGAPVSGGRLSFAGEATSMTHPGTVNGVLISTDVRPHAPTPSLALRASFVRQEPTRPASRPPKSSFPPNLTTTMTTTMTTEQTSKSRDTRINTRKDANFSTHSAITPLEEVQDINT